MLSFFLIMLMTMTTMFTLVIQRKHLLMSLLALEGMILTLTFLIISSYGVSSTADIFLFIILLTFGACEASLGLALLVTMTRSIGTDMVNLLTSSKC
uniref:NADH-ubiquinone oxidoreductase chain 4L n=1 Tax=Melinna cristata TaxID=222004 RepID=A0A8A4VKS6_9ANNE|nr:NADH dehydrogenase subunit 4L [Melinna cristata]QTD82974.1 NADH dehydrogenase subunit 4L [Melinna cristata]